MKSPTFDYLYYWGRDVKIIKNNWGGELEYAINLSDLCQFYNVSYRKALHLNYHEGDIFQSRIYPKGLAYPMAKKFLTTLGFLVFMAWVQEVQG